MSRNRTYQTSSSGFAHLGLILIAVIVIALAGVALWRVQSATDKTDIKSVNDGSSQQSQSTKKRLL